jgi:hypothetical protein
VEHLPCCPARLRPSAQGAQGISRSTAGWTPDRSPHKHSIQRARSGKAIHGGTLWQGGCILPTPLPASQGVSSKLETPQNTRSPAGFEAKNWMHLLMGYLTPNDAGSSGKKTLHRRMIVPSLFGRSPAKSGMSARGPSSSIRRRTLIRPRRSHLLHRTSSMSVRAAISSRVILLISEHATSVDCVGNTDPILPVPRSSRLRSAPPVWWVQARRPVCALLMEGAWEGQRNQSSLYGNQSSLHVGLAISA